MSEHRLKIYFDGGCRPNPGRIEVALVARGMTYLFDDLGEGTSQDAEWLALIKAIEVARELGQTKFDLIGDAESVVGQANGTGKCRGASQQAHLAKFAALAAATPPNRIRWIARTQNLAGIVLAKRRGR
jgi:ribonuclease HI